MTCHELLGNEELWPAPDQDFRPDLITNGCKISGTLPHSPGLARLIYKRKGLYWPTPVCPHLKLDDFTPGRTVWSEISGYILKIVYDFGLFIQLSDIHYSLHQFSSPQISLLATRCSLSSIFYSFLKNESTSVSITLWSHSKSTLSQKQHKSKQHARIRGIYRKYDDWNSPWLTSLCFHRNLVTTYVSPGMSSAHFQMSLAWLRGAPQLWVTQILCRNRIALVWGRQA